MQIFRRLLMLIFILALMTLLQICAAVKFAPKKFTVPISIFTIPTISSAKFIPTEVSSSDSIADVKFATDPMNFIPNTAIESLDGGENLGALLWAYVLYNGLFPISGKPADWMLPLWTKIFGQQQQQWYKDFVDGYSFECPPIIEGCRFLFFFLFGLTADSLWIRLLDGDSFWGWSTGACLTLPSLLITLGRPKKLSRDAALQEVWTGSHNCIKVFNCRSL